MSQMGRGELQVKTGQNGDVELTFKIEGKDATVSLSPDEISGLASHLLAATGASFIQSGRSDDAAQKKFEGPITPSIIVNASTWNLAHTNMPGQRVIIARVGEAAVAFAVTNDRIRGFGRTLIQASWRTQTALSLRTLFRLLINDFFSDLKGWGGIFKARFNASSRRMVTSFWSKVSGRSLRIFRTINISPTVDIPDYDPVGKCIYCGAEVYSEQPGDRRHPLGAEHIIAEGLDGKLELPQASCKKCEDITGRLIEGDILLRTLKALRMHLKIRGKRKSSKPATLPLTITENNKDRVVQMPVEDYPVIFNMPAFGIPGIFVGGAGGNQGVHGFRLVVLNYNPVEFQKKHGFSSFASPYWDTHMFFRMLGKIGHSFAAAELGLPKFKPLLADLILNGDAAYFNHIGGEPDLARDPPSDSLHELGLGYQRANGRDYVVAKVRLFAKQMGPIYYVVVGESLEIPMAKFKRVFTSKISSMLAR
jgi:hypothetical protein